MVADGILFQKRAEGCRSWAGLGINNDMVREAGRVVCRRALDPGSRVGLESKEKGTTVHSFQMHEKSGGKAALGIAFDGRVVKGSKSRCLTRSRSWRAVWVSESTEDRLERSLRQPARRAESIGTRGWVKWWQVLEFYGH